MVSSRWLVMTCVLLASCATSPNKSGKDGQILGVSPPLIGDGMRQTIYFTHLDGRELRNLFNQYPTSLDVAPGAHSVTAVCEWREQRNEVPVAKHVRRFKMDVDPGVAYQFETGFEGAGTCQLGFRDATNQTTASPNTNPVTTTR